MAFWDWKGFGTSLGKIWGSWWENDVKPHVGLGYDMTLAAFNGFDKGSMDRLSRDYAKILLNDAQAGRDTFDSVVHQALGPINPLMATAGSLINTVAPEEVNKALGTGVQWVGRGITTANLVVGPGGLVANAALGDMPGDPLSGESWRKAWNESRHMSPGQSFAASIGAAFTEDDGDVSMDDILGYARKQGNDPHKQEGWYRYSSGALDFGANFLDPLIVAGKVGKLAKIKYVDKPLVGKTADRYLDSENLQKVIDYSKVAKDENDLYNVAFIHSTRGAEQASVLFKLRHDEDAQRLAVRAFLNDTDAMEQLITRYPGEADKVMTAKTQEEWSWLKNREGLGNPDAMEATKAQHLAPGDTKAIRENNLPGRNEKPTKPPSVDDYMPVPLTATERARLAVLDEQRSKVSMDEYLDPDVVKGLRMTLVGQNMPTAGKYAQFRAALQQKSIHDRPMVVRMARPFASGARIIGGDARIITGINVNDPQAIRDLRRYLDRSTLKPEEASKILSDFGSASTPEVKARLINEAEDAIVKSMATEFNLHDKDYQRILNTAQNGRAAARQADLANTRKYVSDQTRTLMRERLEEGGVLEGHDYTTILDDDDILTVAFKENPFLASQLPDVVHLADIDQMRRVFKRNSGKFQDSRTAIGNTFDKWKDVADDFNSVWKMSVLLRGGWTVRMLSDEVFRQAAFLGAMGTIGYGARGTVNAGRNIGTRAKVAFKAAFPRNEEEIQASLDDIAAGLIPSDETRVAHTNLSRKEFGEAPEGQGPITAKAIGSGQEPTTFAIPKHERPHYASLEEAYLNGGITTDDFIAQVERAAHEGVLPETEAKLLDSWMSGGLKDSEFTNKLMDYALSKFDLAQYAVPGWQSRVLAQARKGDIAVDPFFGEITNLKAAGQKLKSRTMTVDEYGFFDNNHLYDFIAENRDLLTHKQTQLGITRNADGSLDLHVFGPEEIKKLPKATGTRRSRALAAIRESMMDKRSQARQGFTKKGHYGVYEVAASFADDLYQKLVSSEGYAGGGMANLLWGNLATNLGRYQARPKFGNIVAATDPKNYKREWFRAVNHQLANDPVARMVLQGKTEDQIVRFLEGDLARGLRRDKPMFASNPRAWALSIQTYVDSYVPDLAWQTAKGETKFLRTEVLNHRANADDFLKLMEREKMPAPDVHGEAIEHALGGGTIWDTSKKAVNGAMRVLGSIPSDIASRNPFFDRAYRAHMDTLIRHGEYQLQDMVPAEDIAHAQTIARQNALKDVKTWLYNSDSVSLLAHKTRFMTAFTGATQDALSAWTRLALRDPTVIVALNKMWNFPDKAGLIVDQDGHQLRLEQGKEVWYQPTRDKNGNLVRVDPKLVPNVGEKRNVILQVPAAIDPGIFGADLSMMAAFPKDSANTFLDYNPGGGPLVTLAANEIMMRNPTLVADDNKVGRYIQNALLPFGPSATWYDPIIPSTLREAVTVWRGEEDTRFNDRTSAIFQTMMYDWARKGKHGKAPTLDEAADRAGKLGLLRLATSVMSPLQFQYKSPMQAYIDDYHIKQRKNYLTADREFYEEHGEEFFWLTGHLSKALPGLPTTVKGQEAFEKYRDLIDQHPDLMGLIIGAEGAGEFSKSVYEWQKANSLTPGGEKMRRKRSPDEIKQDTERRLGWVKYTKLMDAVQADLIERGLKSVNDSGAEDLKDVRGQFLDGMATENKTWWEEFNTHNPVKNEERIKGMVAIAQDPRLRGRLEIQGLSQYLILRHQMQGVLAERAGYGGAKTLEAKANGDLAGQWDDAVMNLIDTNAQFGQLYNRWLTHDKF